MNLKSVVSSTAFCTLLLIVTIFNVAKASEQVIATISRDEGTLIYKLVVDHNDGREIKTFYKDVYEKGVRVNRSVLDPVLLVKNGMILEQREKHIVLKLTSTNFDLEQGGIIIADTLYNGASGERRSYEIQLAKSTAGWGLFKKGKTIKEILIQTNKVMIIGAVGIKNLVMK